MEMKNGALGPGAQAFARAIADEPAARVVLCLYVSGMSPRSTRAIDAIHQLCEEHLSGRYDLMTIDIYQQPDIAKEKQIVAAPTLVKKAPLPMRTLVGEMTDTPRILLALGVTQRQGSFAQ
jgi:circadian clock protein KaiB